VSEFPVTWHPVPPGKGFGALAWYRRWHRAQKHHETVAVPCGDCHLCCRSYTKIYVQPSDHIPAEDTEKKDGVTVLRRHEDGSCVYLVAGKCSIYHNRPASCRVYDCRELLVTSFVGANEHDIGTNAIERFGRPLLKEPDDGAFLVAVKLMVQTALRCGFPEAIAAAFRREEWRAFLPTARRLLAEMKVTK
jgi:hypothetical protein